MNITEDNFDFTASVGKLAKLTVKKTDPDCVANTGLDEGDVIEGVILDNSEAAFGTGPTGTGRFHMKILSMHGVVADYDAVAIEWDDSEWATPEIVARYQPDEMWKVAKGYEITDGWFPTPVSVEILEERK